jgi:hypothetical protein
MSLLKTVSPVAGNVAQVTTKQYNLRKWVARSQEAERALKNGPKFQKESANFKHEKGNVGD